MLLCGDVCNLAALRRAGANRVAIAATDTAMIRVAENRLEYITRLRRAAVWREFVTDVARADLALGRVTRVARRVSLKADGNRAARTARLVTRGAALGRSARAVVVRGVIELHIKAFEETDGKSFHRRRRCAEIFVTDRAHRLFFARELIQVTADAGFVSGKIHLERTAFALVTRSAVELFMFGNSMRKRLERFVRNTLRHRIGRFG